MSVVEHTPTPIAIVIPTFNRVGSMLKCLESVFSQQVVLVHPIVVNDGSQDGTSEAIRQKFPQTQIIEGDGNLWWAGALNLGIQTALDAGFDYIVLLNDDNILEPEAISTLLDYAKSNPFTIVGSLVRLKGTNQISDAGVNINWLRAGPILKDFRKDYGGSYSEAFPVDCLGGQGVLLTRAIYEKTGPINSKDFPQYFADTDFHLRARQQGIKLVVHPRSVVWNTAPGIQPARKPRSLPEAFKRFIKQYVWTGSAYNLKYNSRFLIRHCPIYMLPVAFLYRFASSVRFFYLKNFNKM